MVITMQDDAAQSLNEVVVIGYGVVKKKDLTGSVAALKPDGKNKGVVVNAQDLLVGKVVRRVPRPSSASVAARPSTPATIR